MGSSEIHLGPKNESIQTLDIAIGCFYTKGALPVWDEHGQTKLVLLVVHLIVHLPSVAARSGQVT